MLIGEIRAAKAKFASSARSAGRSKFPIASQPDLDFRGWMQDQGKGEMAGPKVRAAGRIVL